MRLTSSLNENLESLISDSWLAKRSNSNLHTFVVPLFFSHRLVIAESLPSHGYAQCIFLQDGATELCNRCRFCACPANSCNLADKIFSSKSHRESRVQLCPTCLIRDVKQVMLFHHHLVQQLAILFIMRCKPTVM